MAKFGDNYKMPLGNRIFTYLKESLGEMPATIICTFLLTVPTLNLGVTLLIFFLAWIGFLIKHVL